MDQSHRMDATPRAAGVETELIILPGAGHGGPAFSTPETASKVASFFDRHL
jgi:dipeptidyl aminopeptidase/acylaminoacyl peptidase